MDELPVVVIGAGPIGLAAAAHALARGLTPLVLEAGQMPAATVRQWRHVRLFSTWARLVDPAAGRLLDTTGWRCPPEDLHPTGGEWVQQYLVPLAAALGDRVRFGVRVTGVARRGWDSAAGADRDGEPFTVHLRAGGGEERISARAVIDASGTWDSPNPLGADGLPALGEDQAADRIRYRLPDLSDPSEAARYAGRHTAVVGSGHSALTALVALGDLAARQDRTQIAWLLRREVSGDMFGPADADQLPARDDLEQQAKAVVHGGNVDTVTGFRTQAVLREPDGRVVLESADGQRLGPYDEILALTGFRPDLSWLSEVRLDIDPVLRAPRALAPLIDPRVHTCRSVRAHGAAELSHPEPGIFLVGMKSYGRAPAFLAKTGFEQVRSVVATIAGCPDAAQATACGELALSES